MPLAVRKQTEHGKPLRLNFFVQTVLNEGGQTLQQRYYPPEPGQQKVCFYRLAWMKDQGFKLHII